MQNAKRKAKEGGEKTIAARDIRKVTTVSSNLEERDEAHITQAALRSFRG